MLLLATAVRRGRVLLDEVDGADAGHLDVLVAGPVRGDRFAWCGCSILPSLADLAVENRFRASTSPSSPVKSCIVVRRAAPCRGRPPAPADGEWPATLTSIPGSRHPELSGLLHSRNAGRSSFPALPGL